MNIDAQLQARLERVVSSLTDRRQPAALDRQLLAELKALCRQGGDGAAQLAWEATWPHLRASHAQTRLLALLVCEYLFARSAAFRRALCAQLSPLLEAVVGHRQERPLPPPAATAEELRSKALELLEAWAAEHGARHPQLPLAVRYLRDTLQLRFPGIASRAAAAAAERAEREARAAAVLRERLGALLGGGEWREGAAAARQLLREMGECFAILEERQATEAAAAEQRRSQAAAAAAAAAREAGEDGLDWEEVGAAAAQGPAGTAPAAVAAEGLAAYAADDNEEAAAGGAAAEGAGEGSEIGAELEVVLETLAGLHRQLTARTLPQVQDWLSVLGRAEPEGPAQGADQQRLLRSATQLRSQLAAARERCDALSLDLQALLLRRRRREAASAEAAQAAERQQEGQQGAAVAAALQDLFGGSSSGSSGDSSEDDGGATETAAGGRRQRTQNTAAGPGSASRPPPGRRRRQQQRRAADDDFNPYLTMVDPAAPRPRLPAQPAQRQATAAAAPPRTSSLPAEVRRRLAAQAPLLPTGPHTQFWDSKSVPTYVHSGLEVSNHWGPVDAQKELPPERLEEMFLLPMPAVRLQPPAAGAGPPRQPGHGQQQRQQQQQQQRQQQQQAVQQRQQQQGSAVAGSSSRQQPPPQQEQSGMTPAAAASLQPWPSRLAAAAAAAGAAGGEAGDTRAAKRARRAQERAYNEAIIGGALSDELLARQLADAEQAAAGQSAGGSQRGRGGRGGGSARKMGVRERLAGKLLRGRVVAAAVAETARVESELRRDKFGQRW